MVAIAIVSRRKQLRNCPVCINLLRGNFASLKDRVNVDRDRLVMILHELPRSLNTICEPIVLTPVAPAMNHVAQQHPRSIQELMIIGDPVKCALQQFVDKGTLYRPRLQSAHERSKLHIESSAVPLNNDDEESTSLLLRWVIARLVVLLLLSSPHMTQ